MTSELNIVLIHKLRGAFMRLVYSFKMLSMGVCTVMHWQTSDRLVKELDVCTVCVVP